MFEDTSKAESKLLHLMETCRQKCIFVKMPGGKTITVPLHRCHDKRAWRAEVSSKKISEVKLEVAGRLGIPASAFNLRLSGRRTLYRTDLSLRDHGICENENLEVDVLWRAC